MQTANELNCFNELFVRRSLLKCGNSTFRHVQLNPLLNTADVFFFPSWNPTAQKQLFSTTKSHGTSNSHCSFSCRFCCLCVVFFGLSQYTRLFSRRLWKLRAVASIICRSLPITRLIATWSDFSAHVRQAPTALACAVARGYRFHSKICTQLYAYLSSVLLFRYCYVVCWMSNMQMMS